MLHRRLVAAAAGAALFAVAAWLGWADTARSLDLVTGSAVTEATAFALVGTVCWLAVAGVAGVVVAHLLGCAEVARRRTRRAPVVLLAGATLLGIGVAHHNAGYDVCCANAITAQQAEQRVR